MSLVPMRDAMASVREATSAPDGWQPPVPISRWRQVGVNLRLWAPLLSNQSWQSRELKYTARENRRGAKWQVTFPERCWRCDARTALEFVKIDRELRGFENPMGPVVLCPLVALLAVTAAIGLQKPMILWCAPAALVVGAVWLWFKSSRESVELSLAACANHRLGVQDPDVAIFDNELYVFAQSAELATAARKDQTTARRAGRGNEQGGTSSDERPAVQTSGKKKKSKESLEGSAPPPLTLPPRREELPPIKLDDEPSAPN